MRRRSGSGGWRARAAAALRTTRGSVGIASKYVYQEALRRPFSVYVGIFTVVLAVFFITLLSQSMTNADWIFIRFAEKTLSEGDLSVNSPAQSLLDLSPPGSGGGGGRNDEGDSGDSSGALDENGDIIENPLDADSFQDLGLDLLGVSADFFVNATAVQSLLEGVPEALAAAPRWILPVDVGFYNGTEIIQVTSSDGTSTSFERVKFPDYSVPSLLIGLDTKREQEIKFGRAWLGVKTLERHECYLLKPVWDSLVRHYKVSQEQEKILLKNGIVLQFSLSKLDGVIPYEKIIDTITERILKQLEEVRDSSEDDDSNDDDSNDDNPFSDLIPGFSGPEIIIKEMIQQSFQNLTFTYNATIVKMVDDPVGKWPSGLGNTVILDFLHVWEDFAEQLIRELKSRAPSDDAIDEAVDGIEKILQNLSIPIPIPFDPGQIKDMFNYSVIVDQLSNSIQTFQVKDYALTTYIQARDRLEIYSSKTRVLFQKLSSFSNTVTKGLGLDFKGSFAAPLGEFLIGSSVGVLFLDVMVYDIFLYVVILSSLLVYSLLLSDVEEQTYEIGLLRALGMKNHTVALILLLKSLAFAVIGIPIAWTLGYLAYIPVGKLVAEYAVIDASNLIKLSRGTLLFTSVLGLLLPLVSNVAPIRRALSANLRDSLDIYHNVSSGVKVQILKLAEQGVEIWALLVGALMVIVGYVTFVLIPVGFIMQNMALVLNVLNMILVLMMLGLVLVSNALQSVFQILVLHIMFPSFIKNGKVLAIKALVRKSLSGHQKRNSKTALMFSLGIAFVIFAATIFSLQTSVLLDNITIGAGADIVGSSIGPVDTALDEVGMRPYLESLKSDNSSIISDYTFITYRMHKLPQFRQTNGFNMAQFPTLNVKLYGVEPNFEKVTKMEYAVLEKASNKKSQTIQKSAGPVALISSGKALGQFDPKHNNLDYPASVLSQFYDNSLNCTILISAAVKDFGNIYAGGKMILRFVPAPGNRELYLQCFVTALAGKYPGFVMSSYRLAAFNPRAALPIDQFAQILAYVGNQTVDYSYMNIPKQRVLIKVKTGASEAARAELVDGLRVFFKPNTNFVTDLEQISKQASASLFILLIFFSVVGAVAMLLCFFILILSVSANVRENKWELAVLRAIGLSRREVVFLYVAESVIVVIASMAIGALDGLIVSATLNLQTDLFVELPFKFKFPWAVFGAVALMGLVTAVLGSFIPASRALDKSIARSLSNH